MLVDLDILRHDAPFQLATYLENISRDTPVEVVLSDADFCPNRVVPVVGIADEYFSRGYDLRFKVSPYKW